MLFFLLVYLIVSIYLLFAQGSSSSRWIFFIKISTRFLIYQEVGKLLGMLSHLLFKKLDSSQTCWLIMGSWSQNFKLWHVVGQLNNHNRWLRRNLVLISTVSHLFHLTVGTCVALQDLSRRDFTLALHFNFTNLFSLMQWCSWTNNKITDVQKNILKFSSEW